MSLTKRATRKLINTWPQRLAISGVVGFIVWNLTGENLFAFISVILISHCILSVVNNRMPGTQKGFNEEMKC